MSVTGLMVLVSPTQLVKERELHYYQIYIKDQLAKPFLITLIVGPTHIQLHYYQIYINDHV